MFASIGIVLKENLSSSDISAVRSFLPALQNLKVDLYTDLSINPDFKELKQLSHDDFCNSVNLLCIFGGDGTFLSSARQYIDCAIPMTGVNLGSVGFLTDINIDNLESSLEEIISGKSFIEERDLIEAEFGKNKVFGLNEILIHSGSYAQLMRYNLKIDGDFVYEQRSDGLIIATPTGSSAYALSAGGPIIHPELDVLNIIPMMSHSLSSRGLICSNENILEVTIVEGPLESGKVCVDGQEDLSVEFGEKIRVSKKDLTLKVIHPENNNFYESCREKLGWSLDLSVKK